MKSLSITLKIILGILILAILIYSVGINKITNTITKIDLIYLIVVMVIILISLIISAYNIYIFTKEFYRIKFKKILRIQFLGFTTGLITFSKFGDITIAYLLKKEGLKLGESSAIIFLNFLISLVIQITFAAMGAYLYLADRMLELAIIGIILICLVLIIFSKKGQEIVKKTILKKFTEEIEGFNQTIQKILTNHRNAIAKNILFTIIKLVLGSLTLVVLFKSIGLETDLIKVVLIDSIVTIIALIPITINGLGLREASATYLFSVIGIKTEATIVVYLILTILTYLFSAVISLVLIKEDITKEKSQV